MNTLLFDRRSKRKIYIDRVKSFIKQIKEMDNAHLSSLKYIYLYDYHNHRDSDIKNEILLNCEIAQRELIKRGFERDVFIAPIKGILKPFTLDDLQLQQIKLKENAEKYLK